MRAFIILGHKAPLNPDFTLNDLPGSAGRLDVLCRCVNAALFLSHDLRRDVEVFLVLQDQLTICISGQHVKRLNPDERSTAALIKKALERIQHHHGSDDVRSTPGITVSRKGLKQVLGYLTAQRFVPILLLENERSFRGCFLPERVAFVLSDHTDFSETELELLLEFEALKLSVGPQIYPASHCIAVVNNELDHRDQAS